ncbi:MAG: hypothetical protein AB7E81_17920 [Hyphomicrobiaceae bacterium]
MSDLDRMRYAAVKALQAAGAVWRFGAWQDLPGGESFREFVEAADELAREVERRCELLEGAPEGSDKHTEFLNWKDLVEAYDAKRDQFHY